MSALTSAQKDMITLEGLRLQWNENKFRAMSQKTIRLCLAVAQYCVTNKIGNITLSEKVLAQREMSVKVRKPKEVVEFAKADEYHVKQSDSEALMIFYTTLYDEKRGQSMLATTWLLKNGGYANDPEKRADLVRVARGA